MLGNAPISYPIRESLMMRSLAFAPLGVVTFTPLLPSAEPKVPKAGAC